MRKLFALFPLLALVGCGAEDTFAPRADEAVQADVPAALVEAPFVNITDIRYEPPRNSNGKRVKSGDFVTLRFESSSDAVRRDLYRDGELILSCECGFTIASDAAPVADAQHLYRVVIATPAGEAAAEASITITKARGQQDPVF